MFNQFKSPITMVLKEHDLRTEVNLFQPPDRSLGDFCFVVNQVAGGEDPKSVSNQLLSEFEQIDGIESVSITNQGPTFFVNFTIADDTKTHIQTEKVEKILKKVYGAEYGFIDDNKGSSIIVEHTSVNPISPIHVGNLRNSIQGDTFARIQERTGYTVYRHFYVNDVGLQICFVVIGYELAREMDMRPPIKIDRWLGQIYAIMNCFHVIQRLKSRAETRGVTISDGYSLTDADVSAMSEVLKHEISNMKDKLAQLENKDKLNVEERRDIRDLKMEGTRLTDTISDLYKYRETFDDLQDRFPQLFSSLLEKVSQFDLSERVSDYLQRYERNTDERITSLFREVVNWNIQAFIWTLGRYNITFDSFDFESDLTWSGLPTELIDELSKSDYATVKGRAVRYSYPPEAVDNFCQATGISKKDLPVKGQIPDLQLRRSDGTALYAAKDIAYSVKKFKDRQAEKVFNVISAEQLLPQFQLLLPLHELDMTTFAANLHHYRYENVDLRGRVMSGRLAQYITADEYYDETYIRARMAKRSADAERGISLPSTSKEWKVERKTLRAVTLASTRFPLIETAPNKRIELDLDRELDFRRNAGPFVEYAHARTCSLVDKVYRKQGWEPTLDINFSAISDDEIVDILQHLESLDDVIRQSAEEEDPSQVANWCFALAQSFMKFYENFPVLKADDETIGIARLAVVGAIRNGLATGLQILGIPAAEKL